MFVSNRIIFLEKKFLDEGINATKIELSEVHEVEISIHTESDLIGESNPEPVELPLRISNRVAYQLDRYYSFLIRNDDLVELDENDEDLITYIDAM